MNRIRESADVLVADAGGAPAGVSPYDRLKFEFLLRGEIEMGTVAHNIGASEAALGVQSLRELNEKRRAPLISTNVQDAQGQSFVPTHRIVTFVGGRRRRRLACCPRRRATIFDREPHDALMRLIRSLGQGNSIHCWFWPIFPKRNWRRSRGDCPKLT